MSSEKTSSAGRSPGGSVSAKRKGLTGIVVHFTAEERQEIALAAALEEASSDKAFCAAAVLAAAKKSLKKLRNRESCD
jgi:hypothetical protein